MPALISPLFSYGFRTEHFSDRNGETNMIALAIAQLIAIIFVLGLETLIIFYSWNNVITKIVSSARPMRSFWQSFVLLVFVLIFSG